MCAQSMASGTHTKFQLEILIRSMISAIHKFWENILESSWNVTETTPGPQFNIKKTSYQYRKSHCGDKTILRPSYLHNGISYTGKITSLYWIRAQISVPHPHLPPSPCDWANAMSHSVSPLQHIIQYNYEGCLQLNLIQNSTELEFAEKISLTIMVEKNKTKKTAWIMSSHVVFHLCKSTLAIACKLSFEIPQTKSVHTHAFIFKTQSPKVVWLYTVPS